jgi:hypothetical protein
MHRHLTAILILIAAVVSPHPGFAQDPGTTPGQSKNRPFKPADPDDGKTAVGIEVVTPTRRGEPLKVWELDREGPSLGKDDGLVVGIDSITLYPGIMRVTYFFHQKGEKTHGINVVGAKLYIADGGGETYRPSDWQFKPNREGQFKVVVQAGTKERWWVEYPSPTKPTLGLKFGVPVYDFLWSGVAFKPWTLTLNQPLYYDNGVFEEKKAAPAPRYVPGSFGGERDGNGEDRGLAGPMAGGNAPIFLSPKQTEELEQKFRDLSERGMRLDGNLFLSQGRAQYSGRIVFKPRERGDFVEVTMVTLTGTERTFELWGAFFEDNRSETGVTLKLRDSAKVVYTLKLDGNSLRGTDTLGNRFNFLITHKR